MQRRCRVSAEQSLPSLDNVHEETTDTFKSNIEKECHSLVWLHPGECTNAMQPINVGIGALIKVEVGEQLDLWLENGDNFEQWEGNGLTASDRGVFLTKWVATAVYTVDNRAGYSFGLFEKTGSMMTADETGDERICLEGLTGPSAFMNDISEDELARAGR